MTPPSAHVAAASLNQTVGDWSGNRRRIAWALGEARSRGARLVVLPELCISGYSLGDRVLRRGTLTRSWRVLQELLPETRGLVAVIGLPVAHRDVVYDACAVVADGRLVGLVPKENLATGDVQYENRWYAAWPARHHETFRTPEGLEVPIGHLVFEAAGLGRFGVEICEDGWMGMRPGSVHALSGAQIVCNPSASWFTLGKHGVRRQMVQQISREDKVVYLYASLLGCDATRLVFDGSVFLAQQGEILAEGRRFLFHESGEVVDRVVDLATVGRDRTEEGSWRQQVQALQGEDPTRRPLVVPIEGAFGTDDPPAPPPPYWTRGHDAAPVDPSLDWLHRTGLIRRPPTHRDLPFLELELALAMGLGQYRTKSGIRGFTVALSGGRDSSMVVVLVARALRYEHPALDDAALKALVHEKLATAYLGTAHSGSATSQAARALAEELGADHVDVPIQEAVDVHLRLGAALTGAPLSWSNPAHDVPLQNVQARLRGSLIWMLANVRGFLLLATSNKSEAAVGYATMDGDTSGGLAPLTDVPKSLVSAWVAWAAEFHDLGSLRLVVRVPATAELRPPDRAQTDEGDLMPYAILDRILEAFAWRGQDPVDIFRSLWPELAPTYGGDPRAFAAHIRKFVRLFCQAQWKRERYAISFRVTAFDLDPKAGFRFPPVQDPFTAELAELDAYVDTTFGRTP